MKKLLKRQKGFTLIEVLIALTIFVIFITSVTSAYLNIARSQREANAIREIYSEIRYVLSLIGDEARTKTIDYGCPRPADSEGLIPPSNACNQLVNITRNRFLALVDRDGLKRTVFKIEEDINTNEKKLFLAKEKFTGSIWEADEGYGVGTGYKEIELKNIKLNSFEFEIAPLADPFNPDNVACGPVQFQPSVTINTSLEGIRQDVQDFKLDLQTSMSSRVYNKQTDV